jgi:hypothetical protein
MQINTQLQLAFFAGCLWGAFVASLVILYTGH